MEGIPMRVLSPAIIWRVPLLLMSTPGLWACLEVEMLSVVVMKETSPKEECLKEKPRAVKMALEVKPAFLPWVMR